ncbi:MAG TPA: sugar ABC transporter substrate-binding protein [Actinopolymorphaceae bacterium]
MQADHLTTETGSQAGPSRRGFLKGAAGIGIGFAASLGAATSCSRGGGGGQGSAGKVTLVYSGDAEQKKIWEALFDDFRKEHPDIDLEAKNIPSASWSEFFDTVSVQIAGGQVPDIVRVATEGQRLFASRELVLPIDEYIERDKEELQPYFDDVHPNLITWTNELTSPGDETYYLPHGFNTMCIHYNVEVFERAGVEEPTDDWTWEDFYNAAQTIVAKLPGTFAMDVPPAYFGSVMPWLLTNGASTMNADWTASTVASPEAVEAAEFMRSLVAEGLSPKPGGEYDPFTAMAQGKLAMVGGGRWPVISLRNLKIVDKVKIVAWPQAKRKGSPVGWDAYPIMKEAQNKEGAWEFVKFMAGKKATRRFAELAGTIVPPLRSVAQSEAFFDNAPEGSEKLYEALEYATPIPSPDKGNVIEQDIIDTFEQILVGNSEPQAALEELHEKIESNL